MAGVHLVQSRPIHDVRTRRASAQLNAYARVAFDAAPAIARPTGVGVYVRELGRELIRLAPSRVMPIGVRRDGPLAGVALEAETMTWYPSDEMPMWMQCRADRDARAVGAQLVHYTNMYAPVRTSLPFVLTIQDLSLIRYPRYHPAKRVAMAPIMISAITRARAILVPSEATRRELVRLLHVPDRKIRLVPLAALGAVEAPSREATAGVLDGMGLGPRRYLLSLGTLEPRKNHLSLVKAFEGMEPGGAFDRLVLAGSYGWHTSKLRKAIESSPARDRIIVTGYVTDAVRAALLDGCSALAYLSSYEGYGLPVVEAMAAGAAVVTSNVSSLPEAAGGAAVLVDPFDIPAIRSALRDAVARRPALAEAGRKRAGSRTWSDVAAETVAVYDECLAEIKQRIARKG